MIIIVEMMVVHSFMLAKNLYENRMCNQWDNWRAHGPELLL